MADITEHRHGPDRRRQPRGGRRAEDRDGLAPLILLVGDDSTTIERSEAILAKLKFAVSTSRSVEDALRVIPDLRPDLVVARAADEAQLRAAAAVPVVVTRNGPSDGADLLMEDVLRTVRGRPGAN